MADDAGQGNPSIVVSLIRIWAFLLLANVAQAAPWTEALLFHCGFDGSLKADAARGAAEPRRAVSVEFVGGREGQAIRLDTGVIEYSAAGNLPDAEGTIALRLAVPPGREGGVQQSLFTWSGAGADTLTIGLLDNGRQIRTVIRPLVASTSSVALGAIPNVTNAWNHLAVTWRYPRFWVFWNAEVVADADLRSVVGRPAPSFRLGGRSGQRISAPVALDELWIYRRALNARELSELAGLPTALAGARLLQQDFVSPARVVPWEAMLRGSLTEGDRLRLDVSGSDSVTIPWADEPVFVLRQPMPVGTNVATLSLLKGNTVAGQMTNVLVCVPGFAARQ